MRKKMLMVLLVAVLTALACAPVAWAVDVGSTQREVIRYSDGSYLVSEISIDTQVRTRANNSTLGEKRGVYYTASGQPLFSFTVRGTFSYNGRTATALRASYSYQIQNFAWRLQSGRAHCSGNQAVAEGTFSGGLFFSRQAKVTLICSPDGRLS